MEDLIYSFLLQSGYPRASIVFDKDMLGSARLPAGVTRLPSFVIVDPETAEMLSIIDVVDAVDGDTLRQTAIETGACASKLGGKSIQGFVIRVDVQGRTESEQVQFYRIWPNSTLLQLSSKTFPDLDTLRVARKLSAPAATQPVYAEASEPLLLGLEDEEEGRDAGHRPGAGMYVPAFILLALLIADLMFTALSDTPLLSVSQSMLAIGASLLFTLPAAIRFLRG